jgi:hypothetical protein
VLVLRSRNLAGVFVLACVVVCGCKDDGNGYVVTGRNDGGFPEDDAGGTDAGDSGPGLDGALDLDGATMDAAVLGLDATLDLPMGTLILPDGAILLPDGEIIDVDAAIDRYEREIDVSTCDVAEEDTWVREVEFSDEGGFSLQPGPVGFGLAYRTSSSENCTDAVAVMRIPGLDGFEEPSTLFEDCDAVRDVGLLGVSDGFELAWVDNATGSAELHGLRLDEAMQPRDDQARIRLTENELEQEARPVLTELDGRPLLAWFSTSVSPSAQIPISTRILDGQAQALEVVAGSAGHEPRAIALAAMGDDSAVLGFIDGGPHAGVWLQRLDRDGVALGAPTQLSDRVGQSSTIDIAGRSAGGGGAVVYSTEIDGVAQVRFRRLDEQGQAIGVERTLIGPPLRAQGASLHQLGGGYAVVYRALPGGEITEPEIRLMFITKEGNLTRDGAGRLSSYSIGSSAATKSRPTVSVSVEGALMVAWADVDADTENTVLRLVRRKLACDQ